MASKHLKCTNAKPSSALVVLDSITTGLFALDTCVTWSIRPDTRTMFAPLIPLWLEACMHPKADKSLVDMAKKRVEKAANFGDSKLFLYHAKTLNRYCLANEILKFKLYQNKDKKYLMTSHESFRLELNFFFIRLLQDLRPMNDPTIAKYLQGQYGLEENVEIAKARVEYLKANKL